MSSATRLQSKDYRELLDNIDTLRSQGFNRHVDLPEIVVCGDQSAGKSSTLNALSGLSFPTQDKLCTRFPTEIVLRRDPVTSIQVSILPGDMRFGPEKESLASWKPEVSLDALDLEEVIELAKVEMGISTTNIYSDDTLSVKLSGPDQPHLTLVDLPGLFRASNKEQSREQGNMVRRMVEKYMRNPRSIILAVVSAKNEYVLQEVAEIAKEEDPSGQRTIGLITKPDTLDPGSEGEQTFFNMARNVDVELKLGWHVIRNRRYDERHYTLAERNDAEDKFFSKGIWQTLERSRCGIEALTERLSSVLSTQILEQLPDMLQDVEQAIADCRLRLEKLGAPRSTEDMQRRFLSRVSQDFHDLMGAAVEGNYNKKFFGNSSSHEGVDKRLRAVVQRMLLEFSREMRENGEDLIIVDSDSTEHGGRGPDFIFRSDYVKKVQVKMQHGRGRELPGLFNPMIVGDLFVQQCRPWRGITEDLVQRILSAVHKTTRLIVEGTVSNEVADGVLSLIYQGIDQLKTRLTEKTEQLLEAHDTLHAITYSPDLTEIVQTTQRHRRKQGAQKKIRDTFGTKHFDDPESKIYVNPAQLLELFLDETEEIMELLGPSTATDYMQAYYAVALNRFVDDVSTLAVEDCLLGKLQDLFNPTMILDMDGAEISQLAAESKEAANERISVKKKLDILEQGLKNLRRLQKYTGPQREHSGRTSRARTNTPPIEIARPVRSLSTGSLVSAVSSLPSDGYE